MTGPQILELAQKARKSPHAKRVLHDALLDNFPAYAWHVKNADEFAQDTGRPTAVFFRPVALTDPHLHANVFESTPLDSLAREKNRSQATLIHVYTARPSQRDAKAVGLPHEHRSSERARSVMARKFRRRRGRTWEGAKKRHKQAAARGWRHHAAKNWRPRRPKWHGSIKSTAKRPVKRKKFYGPSEAELTRAKREVAQIQKALRKKKGGKKFKKGRSWSGESRRHAQAAARGWNTSAKPGWRPKYRGKKNPTYSGSLSSTDGTARGVRSKKAGALLGKGMKGTVPLFAPPKKVKKAKKLKGRDHSRRRHTRRFRSRRGRW